MPLRFEKNHHAQKRFLDLLLLADEQESMIDRYLERGEMFVARNDGTGRRRMRRHGRNRRNRRDQESGCTPPVSTERIRTTNARISGGVLPGALPDASRRHRDVPRTPRFYERCGYVRSHLIPGFFTDHYDHPIIEDGRQLVDMVYLKKSL